MGKKSLFAETGAHILVDGQYGSTGKGVLAAWLAAQMIYGNWGGVISNAGPNSGHTFYHGDEKHVLKQLPTFAVAAHLMGYTLPIILSAGAIIDPVILIKEAEKYPGLNIAVHPNAAVITDADRHSEADPAGTISAVAGTRSGTGMALARKIMRDPEAIIKNVRGWDWPENVRIVAPVIEWWSKRYFVEVSQGFSLGLNQPFYPKCTSRECTVSQALADAGLPPAAASRTYMSCRTYPIRVGNVDGHSSGEWYPDQREVTWEELGQTPELTTVTQRVRRIATFSQHQFLDACVANNPDFVFMNFMNYLSDPEHHDMIKHLRYLRDGLPQWFELLFGHGPKSEDVSYNG